MKFKYLSIASHREHRKCMGDILLKEERDVMIISLHEVWSMETVNIKYVYKYLVNWPIGSILLVYIGHTHLKHVPCLCI